LRTPRRRNVDKVCKIELIGDGDGSILVFVDGVPFQKTFYAEFSIPDSLEALLKWHLCKYKPEEDNYPKSDDEEDASDEEEED
jgi:hypothetical protein